MNDKNHRVRSHDSFRKSLGNLPDGVCQDCCRQLSNINREFNRYKYNSDREECRIIPVHTECLNFILQRIEKYTNQVETTLDICDLASELKRICDDCHTEIKEKISDLKTNLHSDSNKKMVFMHASCLIGLLMRLAEMGLEENEQRTDVSN